MIALASVLIAIGEVSLWLDLGNRLFGSYARTPIGSLARILLIVLVLIALGSPLAWLWIDTASKPARLSVYAAVVATAFLHFVFPYRWKIHRLGHPPPTSTDSLVPGIILLAATMEFPGLPKSVDGISCVVLSDLHCNDEQKLRLLSDAIDQLQQRKPDLVIHLGDFGENRALLPEVVANVTRLVGRLGTFCVLGNHDYEGGRQSVLTGLLARAVRARVDR